MVVGARKEANFRLRSDVQSGGANFYLSNSVELVTLTFYGRPSKERTFQTICKYELHVVLVFELQC